MAKLDKRLTKWICWLKVIKVEVQDLVIAKDTFLKVQKLIEGNPLLHQPSPFYRHFSSTYVSHAVIGLRRQIKGGDQSISMSRLFEEMIETPEILTRAYFVKLYEGSVVQDFADKDFNGFADPGAPYIDASRVRADLARLRAASGHCEEFADKRVAHRDKKEPKILPTYNDVHACIDLLNDLYSRYYLLFHACTMETLLPVYQTDWKAVFRIPWIPPGK